jgi:hypothetical protein
MEKISKIQIIMSEQEAWDFYCCGDMGHQVHDCLNQIFGCEGEVKKDVATHPMSKTLYVERFEEK